ncbi:MAG: hypothetical protein SH856_05945 [Flavobacteriales bacterium]|nr:hypothetical protein [Flavobacteriales bacterium]
MNTISTSLFSLCFVLTATINTAQCDETVAMCEKNISENYISDGQVYWAFLQKDEISEFETLFFSGSTYRISASTGNTDGGIIFRIYDQDKNELFSNAGYSNAPYWDFKTEFSTMTVTVEAQLDPNKTSSGCAVLLIGIKR